jgi:hypothetical protein
VTAFSGIAVRHRYPLRCSAVERRNRRRHCRNSGRPARFSMVRRRTSDREEGLHPPMAGERYVVSVFGHHTSRTLASRLEELDWIAVRILDLNLSAGRARFHLVPEVHVSLLQPFDRAREVTYAKHDAIPAA